MAKRRSKKQKQKAKHQFTISYTPRASDEATGSTVKGQTKTPILGTKEKSSVPNNALNKAEEESLGRTKREKVKSLSLASLVLGLEVVIYLISRG